MSPYRVVVQTSTQEPLVVMQAMYYRNKHTGKRGILILQRIMPELGGEITLDQKIQESYTVVTETNSLVLNGYGIEMDKTFPQKYAVIHYPHFKDSSRYVLPDRHNLLSECQRDCMLDFIRRNKYSLIRVI